MAGVDGHDGLAFAILVLPAGGEVRDRAEEIPGPTTERFQDLVAELGVVTVRKLFERDGDNTYDCSPIIDAEGSLVGKGRMIHITDYPLFHERGCGLIPPIQPST